MSNLIYPGEQGIVVPGSSSETKGRAKYLGHEEVFADEIALTLRDPLKSRYINNIGRETRKGLNNGLRGVARWIDLGGEEKNPDFKENDLDHVVGLIKWCNEIEDRFPLIKKAVTGGSEEVWQDLIMMLIMHDIGEIATGDFCRSHPDFTQQKGKIHKRKEALAALSMLSKYAPPEIAGQLKRLYKRFDERLADDKLVNLGHTLDKCQADATAAREIIPYNMVNPWAFNGPSRIYDRECNGITFAEKLAKKIDDKQARVQLAQFILEKVVSDYDKLKTPSIGAIQIIVRDRINKTIIGG